MLSKYFQLSSKIDNSVKVYLDSQILIEDLKNEKTDAIKYLTNRVWNSIFQIGKSYRLVDEDIVELHSDCIMIFIDKLRNNKYNYQGFEPSSYVIEIAKKRIFYYVRNATKYFSEDIELHSEISELSDEIINDELKVLESLLDNLSDKCRKLIALKYFDNIKDKEVIAKNYTQYTTVDALKNHRSQCMKKLLSAAKQINFNFYE